MICPLCGRRKARRACPALGHQICAVCCGTKRLVEIQCPADCPYLVTSREHPPAVVVRRQERDIGALLHATRDFNESQSQLFFALTSLLAGYRPPELQPLIDLDVADAAAAVAATLETSARGVIYEHRPASLPAERLAGALKSLIAKAGGHAGSAFERDGAVVLRRIEEAARRARESDVENRRAFLDLILRLVKQQGASQDVGSADPQTESSRLIVP